MATGLHILADFHGIDFSSFNMNEGNISEHLSYFIAKCGLKELGGYGHTFNKINEFTIVKALAESHVSLHTWPEKDYVSVDVFVCGVNGDNSEKARTLYEDIKNLFDPKDIKLQLIER